MERKTPLYETHMAAGGRIVPFAGYLLPVQYGTGVIAEHMAVRQKAGLFDVSHMGEVIFKGPDALQNLNRILTNDFTSLAVGKVRYSAMCLEDGGMVDDLIVYRLGETLYLVVVNASNREKDVAHMRKYLSGDCEFQDISDSVAQLALQGPAAPAILRRLMRAEDVPEKYYSCTLDAEVSGIRALVSRTGYTGELGYEIYCAPADAPVLWEKLLETGASDGLIPCGLGARDTLRLEAAMPLYGHEMDESSRRLKPGWASRSSSRKTVLLDGKRCLHRPPLPVCALALRSPGAALSVSTARCSRMACRLVLQPPARMPPSSGAALRWRWLAQEAAP